MRRVSVVIAVVALLACGTTASASALSLLRPYVVNVLQDLDYEALLNVDGSLNDDDVPTVTEGDIFYGMYQVESMAYDPVSPPPEIGDDAFTGIFALKVVSSVFDDTDNEWDMVFGPTTAAEFFAVTGVTPVSPGTIGVVFSDGVKDFGAQWIDPTQVFPGPGPFPIPGIPDPSSAVGTALWEFGFTAVDAAGNPVAGPHEFWKAIASDNIIQADVNIEYASALNLTHTYPGAPRLLKHQYLTVVEPFIFTGPTHLQLEGDRGEAPEGVWGISTDTDLFIKPVPEPGTLALLGLGLLGVGGVVYRRRRKE
jgi:hypothetical protein